MYIVACGRVSALRLGDCGVEPWSGYTKDLKNGIHWHSLPPRGMGQMQRTMRRHSITHTHVCDNQ